MKTKNKTNWDWIRGMMTVILIIFIGAYTGYGYAKLTGWLFMGFIAACGTAFLLALELIYPLCESESKRRRK